MAEPVIVTVHYTPPGAPDTDSLHLELHAEPGARLTVHLGTPARPLTSADIPAQPQPEPPDWNRPGLPADCAPGTEPALLTDTQAHARIQYGLSQGWTQRRIGEFAGRSATVVNRVSKKK
ncbi:helix-turn-helix domain-containing protein [Streptomyces sp. NPDC048623]|uniref:helix-turn-helix domain-containing protein n=1 Tax=Streptomyces sp. NPDC048623 TaxID=3155761 RepID=UPI0034481261